MPGFGRFRIDRTGLVLGVTLTAAAMAVAEFDGGRLDDLVFDQFQRWAPRSYDPDLPVRIVDIDRASIDKYGQWPWPRLYLAELVDRLTGAGAAAIGFDMLFSEPDRTSPEIADATLDELKGRPSAPNVGGVDLASHDVAFSRALARSQVALGAMISPDAIAEEVRPKASFSIIGADPQRALTTVHGLDPPLPVLQAQSAGLGVIGVGVESSSIVRSLPLLIAHDGRITPALSLEMLRLAVGARSYLVKSTEASGEARAGRTEVVGVRVGPLEIPLAADGSLRLRFSGPNPARTISAAEILGAPEPDAAWRAEVEGRILLVGSSAPGIAYLVNTPVANGALGVELHAEVIEQILTGDFLSRPYWAQGAERLLLILFGLVATVIMSMGRPLIGGVFVALGVGAVFYASWMLMTGNGFLFGPVAPAIGALAPLLGIGAVNYARSDAEKRAIRTQFEHFLAPEVIAEIAADPQKYLTPGGEERDLSIMFCDVRGFSTITEKMTPQEVVRFVNSFLSPISDAILDHGGTIDKYMGDAVMAFWNAPRAAPDYRAQAVGAAFAIRRAVAQLNIRNTARGLAPIGVGVGLNNGPCSVGAMGSARRLEYSCIGDAVNLASRLEGLTKLYGVWNCVGASALIGVEGVTALELDLVVVKGRTQPERIHTLIAEGDEADPRLDEIAAMLHEARQAFIGRDWDRAERLFVRLQDCRTDAFDPAKLCLHYLERIAAHRRQPPAEGWVGEFAATAK